MKNLLIYCLFTFYLAFLASSLSALSSAMGAQGLGAASLGAGGAGVATVRAGEALHWNPAALPDQGWDLGYSLGSGGLGGGLHQALSLAGDLGEGLHAGLLVSDLSYGAVGFRESQLGGAVAVAAGRRLSLGTIQRLRTADPGGLRGWSMDLGALAGLPLARGWALRLGVAAADLASSLAWGNGLEEVQPAVLRLGAALEARPGWWLALQHDHLDRQAGSGAGQWRLGGQAAFLDQALSLRAGATQAQGGALHYTLGLGGQAVWAGQGWGLDYALLVPAEAGPGLEARHVLALRWKPQAPRVEPQAGLRNYVKDPASGKVHARIALAEGPPDTEAWQLDLKDREGRVVRSFKGRGPLPPSVAWDGKDADGALVAAEGLSYDLRTTTAGGRMARRRSLLGPAGADLAGLDQDLARVDGGFGLRGGGAVAAPARARARLKGDGSLQVQGADFDLSGLRGSGDGEWSLRIRDESGQTVREIRGRGELPRTLRWEGVDDLGRPVEIGLGATYEIRVTDASGRQQVREHDLVRPETLAQARRPLAPPPAPAAPRTVGAGAASCRVQGVKVVCDFRFEPGSHRLAPQARAALEEALFLAAGVQGLRIQVTGHAAEGEGPDALDLSQARADAVLRLLVESQGLDPSELQAKGLGPGRGPHAELSIDLAP